MSMDKGKTSHLSAKLGRVRRVAAVFSMTPLIALFTRFIGQKPCLRKYLFCALIALKTAINKRHVSADGIAVALEGRFRNTKKIKSCYPRSMAYNVTLTAR